MGQSKPRIERRRRRQGGDGNNQNFHTGTHTHISRRLLLGVERENESHIHTHTHIHLVMHSVHLAQNKGGKERGERVWMSSTLTEVHVYVFHFSLRGPAVMACVYRIRAGEGGKEKRERTVCFLSGCPTLSFVCASI